MERSRMVLRAGSLIPANLPSGRACVRALVQAAIDQTRARGKAPFGSAFHASLLARPCAACGCTHFPSSELRGAQNAEPVTFAEAGLRCHLRRRTLVLFLEPQALAPPVIAGSEYSLS